MNLRNGNSKQTDAEVAVIPLVKAAPSRMLEPCNLTVTSDI